MREGDIISFSPNFRYIDLNWEDNDILIKAFDDRVTGFYLEPAISLNENKQAFASGLVSVATIDFLSTIQIRYADKVGQRIEKWLHANIPEFLEKDPGNKSQTLGLRFYKEFRNGLVHEGRIKNCGQFSYSNEGLITFISSAMIINPETLLKNIESAFSKYLIAIRTNGNLFEAFKCSLLRIFQNDYELAKG